MYVPRLPPHVPSIEGRSSLLATSNNVSPTFTSTGRRSPSQVRNVRSPPKRFPEETASTAKDLDVHVGTFGDGSIRAQMAAWSDSLEPYFPLQ